MYKIADNENAMSKAEAKMGEVSTPSVHIYIDIEMASRLNSRRTIQRKVVPCLGVDVYQLVLAVEQGCGTRRQRLAYSSCYVMPQ